MDNYKTLNNTNNEQNVSRDVCQALEGSSCLVDKEKNCVKGVALAVPREGGVFHCTQSIRVLIMIFSSIES